MWKKVKKNCQQIWVEIKDYHHHHHHHIIIKVNLLLCGFCLEIQRKKERMIISTGTNMIYFLFKWNKNKKKINPDPVHTYTHTHVNDMTFCDSVEKKEYLSKFVFVGFPFENYHELEIFIKFRYMYKFVCNYPFFYACILCVCVCFHKQVGGCLWIATKYNSLTDEYKFCQ